MRKREKNPATATGTGQASNLVRGLSILRAFTPQDTWLGNQDLIERTDLPKATVSRLTGTLTAMGYLLYDEDMGRYRLGPATVSLGYSALSSSAVVQLAAPLMQELADHMGVAVALGTRDGSEMVYLANARSQGPVSLRLNVGSRLPIWRTAMGLAWLVGTTAEIRAALIDDMLATEPEHADEIRCAVGDVQRQYREKGFITSCGHWFSYINAAGIAFQPADGSPLVAITCGGIVDMIPMEACRTVAGPALRRLVERLQAGLEGADDPGPLPDAFFRTGVIGRGLPLSRKAGLRRIESSFQSV